MNRFIKLKNGAIIYVLARVPECRVVIGFNLVSPNLRTKAYHNHKIDEGVVPEPKEAIAQLKAIEFYNLDKPNKYHTAELTKRRHKDIVRILNHEKLQVQPVTESQADGTCYQ